MTTTNQETNPERCEERQERELREELDYVARVTFGKRLAHCDRGEREAVELTWRAQQLTRLAHERMTEALS